MLSVSCYADCLSTLIEPLKASRRYGPAAQSSTQWKCYHAEEKTISENGKVIHSSGVAVLHVRCQVLSVSVMGGVEGSRCWLTEQYLDFFSPLFLSSRPSSQSHNVSGAFNAETVLDNIWFLGIASWAREFEKMWNVKKLGLWLKWMNVQRVRIDLCMYRLVCNMEWYRQLVHWVLLLRVIECRRKDRCMRRLHLQNQSRSIYIQWVNK